MSHNQTSTPQKYFAFTVFKVLVFNSLFSQFNSVTQNIMFAKLDDRTIYNTVLTK